MSTETVILNGSATKTATSGAATLGVHGLIGVAAGVLALGIGMLCC